MTDPDDGFGPPLAGGGSKIRLPTPPPPSPGTPPSPADDGFGPAVKGRRRLHVPRPWSGGGGRRTGGRRRVGRTLLIVVLVLVLLVVGTGAALAISAMSKLNRLDVDGLRPAGGQMNILVVGSDSREGLTRRQRNRLGTGHRTEGARTDTIMLLSIRGGRAAMLSFPRDLYVTRCDGTTGRINGAYASGGPSCLVKTVSDLADIPVSHYMEINFLGFANMVRAVGGVRMCLERPIDDRDAHIDLPAGCQRLNGREALGFVRVRKIDDDLGRIGRQQQFLKALATKIGRPATVLNVPRLFSTTNAVASALTVDEGMGAVDLAKFGWAGYRIGGSGFPTFAVPGTPAWAGGASVLRIDDAEAQRLFEMFRDGSVFDLAGGDVAPTDVEMEISNGAGVPGLAGRAAEYFESRGYKVVNIGNAEERGTTVVRHTRGNKPKAEAVARELGGDVAVRRNSSGPDVEVILGADAVDLIGDR